MKKIILLVLSATPVVSIAHSGHGIVEQVHGFLHVEHLLALVAIIAIALFAKAINK